jgi:hypothetical protein
VSVPANSVVLFFSQPAVAAVLGILIGASMLVATYRGSRMLTPDYPELGAARAMALTGVGLFAAFGCLMLYFFFARDGLVAFGLGLVAGFMVPAFIALFTISGIARPSSRGGRSTRE